MRHYFLSLLALSILISFSSCSSEETPEERLLGSWTGSILEDNYGFFQADITFSEVSLAETIARISYGANDKSLCNNDIFFCDEPSEACNPTWTYRGFNSGAYNFFERPNGDFCAPGNITLRLLSNDELSYRFIGSENADIMAAGSLIRN